ncbi:MAG: hypothetical protein MJ213_00720 [Bacilli bacterium]|nr:hypothetical protein [Bacilli bacterium]
MKKHIKLILRTFISNNACVEAARTKEKKYTIIGIIFALFALFFAALPTCVTGFQQNGGNWIRGSVNYSFDTAMRDFGEVTSTKNVSFKIEEDEKHNHKLTANNWDAMDCYPNQEGENALHCFISTVPNVEDAEEHKIMEIYHCDESVCDFALFVEEIAKNINPLKIKGYINAQDKKAREETAANMLESETKDDKTTVKARTTSFIVFGTYHVQGALCPPGVSQIASSVYGDYNNTHISDEDFIHTVLAKPGASNEEILKSNQTFYDQVFVNVRRTNTWRSTGIILGVDAGVILLMGFMVWILTRGKNNPFRIYSFWDGQKIAYYASLTPGIIALFGFLMQNMAMMLFILGVGVRVMWLSMKTLRYQSAAK